MATQTCSMLLAFAMGLLVVTGSAQLWHVFVFALLLGTGNAFDTPTRQAFVAEMVGPERLPNAVALNSATFNSARLAGPAVGGVVIAAFGVGPAFLLNAASYLAVLAGLLAMRPAELVRGKRMARASGQLVEGLRYVASRPDLVQVLLLVAVVGTLGMNFNLTLPLLAKTEFKVDAAMFGLLSTAFAAGALGGALVGTRRRTRPSARLLLTFAITFSVLEMAVAFAPSFALAMVVLVPTGSFLIAHNNAANARMQLGTPARLRGRVMSLYMLVFLGGTPLGSLVVGAISERWGARVGTFSGGLAVLLCALVLAAWQWRLSQRPALEFTPAPLPNPRDPSLSASGRGQ
jgi:predicted MFS family arabinose efflux permease